METLRILRKDKGLSMKELGNILGVAESTISLYENNKREPDQAMLLKIAEYFNVSVDYLLGRDEIKYIPHNAVIITTATGERMEYTFSKTELSAIVTVLNSMKK